MAENFNLPDHLLEQTLSHLDIQDLVDLANKKLEEKQVDLIVKEFIRREEFVEALFLPDPIVKALLKSLDIRTLLLLMKLPIPRPPKYQLNIVKEIDKRPLSEISTEELEYLLVGRYANAGYRVALPNIDEELYRRYMS